jgi:PAS domain S-box-containing protein
MAEELRKFFPGRCLGLESPVDLETWRIWFARALILMGAVLFPLGAVFSLPQHLADGHLFLSLINLGVWGILLARCFSRPDAYRGNAAVILLLLYILTISYFVTLGPEHARPAWLVVCAVMAALMFGIPGAVAATVANAVFLLVLYEVMGPENRGWADQYQAPYYRWLLFVINSSLLTITTSLPVGYMLKQLDKSLKYERESQKRLSEEGERLKSANAALAREVALRRETEKELRERETYQRILFEKAPDGHYLFDPDGTVVDINHAMEQILGAQKDEIVGKRFYETGAILPELVTTAIDTFNKQFRGETLGPFEWDLMRKDGNIAAVEVNSFPLLVHEKKHLLGIARDVTGRKREEKEREQLENRLLQAQKMEAIGTLAGGIAHDFNNILSGVIGYAELALTSIGDSEDLKYHLDGVLKAGNRARDLVRQILIFSRYEADQKIYPVKVKSVIRDVLKMMRATLPTTIEIQFHLESEAFVLADPVQLHQVFMNLCTNSGQAIMESGGVLGVHLSDVSQDSGLLRKYPELDAGPHVEIAISDTGKGIPAELMDKIFDPYFTTKSQGEGSGLGLSIVHGIVKNSGGVLAVQSEPNRETVFRIYLPVTKEFFPEKDETSMVIPTGTEKILLVDDEPAIIEIGQTVLGRLGYRVEAKTSSLEALSSFEKNPDEYDLVMTDMTMPGFTGKELAKRMMAIRADIPIILCTGFSYQIDREETLQMGIKAFIIKPFKRQQLAGTVRQVLDEAAFVSPESELAN